MSTTYQEIMVAIGGGLNTSNNPSSIDPDQLVEAIGMEYRPPRQGLFAALGRTRADYGATALGGTKVQGLVALKVAESTTGLNLRAEDYFLDFYGASAWVASADADGQLQFRSVPTGNGAVRWDSTATAFAKITHYEDSFYAYNGVNRNLRFTGAVFRTGTPSMFPHGMIAVTASASSVATAFAGATLLGDYEVWWTESYQGLPSPESAYDGTPTKQTISATGLAILITLPAGIPFNQGVVQGTLWCGIAGQKYPFGYANQYISIASGNTYYVTSEVTNLNGLSPNSNNFYETVGPPDGISVSRDDRPPKAYDMTVFQDCLVCIDSDDRSLLKYSMPGFVGSFPSVHYIPFELESNDDLNAVTVCNNALLVFTSRNGFRVDDLPFSTDGDNIFAARGRAKEPFSIKHGCLSPLGYAVFEVFGSGQLCVFICRDGIHITDGFKTDYASTDLDWYNTVDSVGLSRATLYNNPKYQRIEFRYLDKTDNTAWKCLDFYYHPQMLKESRSGGGIAPEGQVIRGFPRLPILGPRDVPGPVVTLGTLAGDWQTWSGSDYGATAFSEASGTTDGAHRVDANGTINKSWKTKDFYPFDISREGNVYNVFTHQSNVTASGTYTVTGTYVVSEENPPYSATSTVDQSKTGAQSHFDLHSRTQRFSLRGAKNDTGIFQELNYIVMVVDKYGKIRSAASNV